MSDPRRNPDKIKIINVRDDVRNPIIAGKYIYFNALRRFEFAVLKLISHGAMNRYRLCLAPIKSKKQRFIRRKNPAKINIEKGTICFS